MRFIFYSPKLIAILSFVRTSPFFNQIIKSKQFSTMEIGMTVALSVCRKKNQQCLSNSTTRGQNDGYNVTRLWSKRIHFVIHCLHLKIDCFFISGFFFRFVGVPQSRHGRVAMFTKQCYSNYSSLKLYKS